MDDVAAANRSFYEAFEAARPRRHVVAVGALRPHRVHPSGVDRPAGWASVAASWAALFQSPSLQFILTNEQVAVEGDVGWVSVDENIIGERQATVAALNVFVRRGSGWAMVAHHGSGVVASQESDEP
ncbi:MAG: nuclear transport factor 2 family protein [Acidimicrobiia bacterium]|nr:nuclear transport factor 2 family protein [Acidimicrobiia bacterium]